MIRIAAYSLTVILALVFTWCGQQFLAHNTYNDADSSFFAYGGWLISQGGELYHDFWDQKPPLIFYQNAILIRCFGLNFHLWAWPHMLVFLGTLVWLFRELNKFWSWPLTCGWAIAVAWAFNLNNYLDFGNRTEFGVAIAEALAFAFVLKALRKEEGPWFFSAGVMTAVATLYKPIGMAPLLATLPWCAIFLWSENYLLLKVYIKKTAWMAFGFVFGGLMLCLPLVTHLEDIWKAAIVVPLSFRTTNHLGLLDVALNTIKQLGPLWGILCPALLSPLVLWIAFRENKRGQQQRRIDFQIMAWLFLWASAGLCGVLLQRHGHPHYMHPTIIPLITLSFYIVHLLKHFLGRPPLVLMALLWLGLALHFSRYFILRQFVQVYRIQEYEDQYQPYRDLGAWVQDNLDPDHTFCYWSMGYTPYLQAKKLCPTLVTPSFVEFGDTGAEWVGRDLVSMMKRDDISHLIENPETFPRNIANPLAYPEGSKSRQVIMAYSQWKLEKFRRAQHDIAPFKIFERR